MKEAEAKADLHASKARHAAETLESKQAGHHYHIPGTGIVSGTGHHVPGTGHQTHAHHVPGTGHQTHGGATGPGILPESTTTTTTHNYQGYPPPYNKHL